MGKLYSGTKKRHPFTQRCFTSTGCRELLRHKSTAFFFFFFFKSGRVFFYFFVHVFVQILHNCLMRAVCFKWARFSIEPAENRGSWPGAQFWGGVVWMRNKNWTTTTTLHIMIDKKRGKIVKWSFYTKQLQRNIISSSYHSAFHNKAMKQRLEWRKETRLNWD